jgi:hypothetical protein
MTPPTGSATGHLLRRVYRRLLAAHPAAFFALAGIRSHLAARRAASAAPALERCDFRNDLPPACRRRIARRTAVVDALNREFVGLVENCGLARLTPLIRCRRAERISDLHARKQPAILVGWHYRTFCYTVVTALHKLGLPALVVGYLPTDAPPGIEMVPASRGNAAQRAWALKRTLDHLNAGGMVYTCIDPPIGGGAAEVSFFGQRLGVRRGSAVLARLSGAPLIPVTPRWNAVGSAIDVTFHDPLPASAGDGLTATAVENAILDRAVRWVEDYLRICPEELCPERLAGSIVAASGGAATAPCPLPAADPGGVPLPCVG